MTIGHLTVEKTNKGFKVTLIMDNGKPQSPDYKRFDETFIKGLPQNMIVYYELKGGTLDKVSTDEARTNVIFPIQSTKPIPKQQGKARYGFEPRNPTLPIADNAHAPYNFVPINEVVIKSPIEVDQVHFNSYAKDRFTGEIELYIETLTPMFIRGMKHVSDNSTNKTPEFFQSKDYGIPGSSLRGAIRNILEIVSYSKLGSITKNTATKRFHYRAFADQSLSLREEYTSKMIAHEGNPPHYFPRISAGVMTKEGLNYYIYPGKHYKVEEELVLSKGVLSQPMSIPSGDKFKANKNYKTGFKEVFFSAGKEDIYPHSKLLKYTKVKDINSDKNSNCTMPGYLIHSGWIIGSRERPRGKHMHWVIGDIQYGIKIQIPRDVIENYSNDTLREGLDLFGKLNNKKDKIKEVPCFYIVNPAGVVTSFGFTGMFRLAYDRTLIEFLPEDHKTKLPDFAEVLFGKNDIIPSRVFIEDAFLKEGSVSTDVRIPSILGSPKPTTFQHYLEQDRSSILTVLNARGQKSGYEGIVDYNQEGRIRGNKLYWHQKSVNYPPQIEISERQFIDYLKETNSLHLFPNPEINNSRIKFTLSKLSPKQHDFLINFILTMEKVQYTAIRPMLDKAKFSGRIRFENLTEVELGALMFILDLPDNLCYKIGMGKALGFGSVRIKPTFYISDRKVRYSNLVSEWGENSNPLPKLSDDEVSNKKQLFENFILSQVNPKSKKLWDEERMKELKTMLDFGNSVSGEKADFMMINKPIIVDNKPVLKRNGQPETENEYKSRPILPNPSEYIKRK
ncbi:MAG: TIGR03986 family CRISPR-associated RAMP protein [Bacteroidota bacterium]